MLEETADSFALLLKMDVKLAAVSKDVTSQNQNQRYAKNYVVMLEETADSFALLLKMDVKLAAESKDVTSRNQDHAQDQHQGNSYLQTWLYLLEAINQQHLP
jgi:TorA maturation chaperone TorD